MPIHISCIRSSSPFKLNPLPKWSHCTSRLKAHLRAPHLAHHTSINIIPFATSSASSTLHMRPTNGTHTPRKTPSSYLQWATLFHVLGYPYLCFVQTKPHYFILLVIIQRQKTMPFTTLPSYFTFSPVEVVPHLPWSKYFTPHACTISTIIAGSHPPWKSYQLQGFFPSEIPMTATKMLKYTLTSGH